MFEAGVFLIDKPVGPSSFRMVQKLRWGLGMKKVGHTGTLDPFASGLLIICAGRPATRIISRLMEGDKIYEAHLKLGVETETFDREGKISTTHPVDSLSPITIERCLEGFTGEQFQTPPQYSALKHKGKPLYFYARKGIVVEKEPRKINIHEIQCLGYDHDALTIQVTCSKGTYIRTLASEIGRKLGCGAHLAGLRRLENGPFSVEQAIAWEQLSGEQKEVRETLTQQALTVDETLAMIQQYKESKKNEVK